MPAPLPLSRSQIEKLGKRLVASERPAAEDLLLLNELQVAYRYVLSAAAERVRTNLPHEPVSRVKTQGTTIDKLRLNGGSWLSSIQDLAGMRIVADLTRGEQDALVSSLVELFADEPKAPKVIDRRASPSSGYRAVHVVVYPGGVQVEIQVRTRWQHDWADFFERLADRFGRQIRYGGEPDGTPAGALDRGTERWAGQSIEQRRELVAFALAASDRISEREVVLADRPDHPERAKFDFEAANTMAFLRGQLSLHDAVLPMAPPLDGP